MSAREQMSYVALHSYWVSCMESNVPTELIDPRTIERVASLLRSQGASPVTASLPALKAKAEPEPEAMRCPQQPERNTPLVARVPSDSNGGLPDE
jgi:hypothetical protein